MINKLSIIKLIRFLQINRMKRNTQINTTIDLFEDRKREIAEYYNTTPERITEIHNGPDQHEFFDDITTDKKLLSAYQARSKRATVSHMLSYNRFDQEFCVLKFCNKKYGLKNRDSVRVLDYGCSIADYGLIFAIAGYSVTLCDISSGNINVGKWRFDKRRLSYNFIEVGLSNLYPKIEMMDLVIAGEVLEHIRNPKLVVENIYNGLRPDGYFWTSGYPVTDPEIGKNHPDHLVEAARMREEVLTFLEQNFNKKKIAKGHLFQRRRL